MDHTISSIHACYSDSVKINCWLGEEHPVIVLELLLWGETPHRRFGYNFGRGIIPHLIASWLGEEHPIADSGKNTPLLCWNHCAGEKHPIDLTYISVHLSSGEKHPY